MDRILTITIRADWKAALRGAMTTAKTGLKRGTYMGETLNFETPVAFFSRLTSNRWTMLTTLQGAGTMGVRELARHLNRDVKRVHEDASALTDLGLIERSESGKLLCPYADIHVDMHIIRRAA
jgi:predicted transcriptional regulator